MSNTFRFNDQELREELVWAHMRLRIAGEIARRVGDQTITPREFLKHAIRVEPKGLGLRDLVIIGECFGLSGYDIRVEAFSMVAEKHAVLDQSYRLGLPVL